MATDELMRLAVAALRHPATDGEHGTTVPGLMLYRSSAPSDHDAVVCVPALCIAVQGAKEAVVGGEAYRYDPAPSLLVSVDLPASARVVEALPERPYLAIRISLDLAVVGEFLADGTAAPPHGPPTRGLALTRVEPPLLDAVGRLVALLDAPGDVAALAPLIPPRDHLPRAQRPPGVQAAADRRGRRARPPHCPRGPVAEGALRRAARGGGARGGWV